MTTMAQRSFSGGEIAPALYARCDTVKYQTGVRTLRNFVVMRHGGATNRAGSTYIGEVKDSTKYTRLIPFVFNTDQTYMLEFGDSYLRVIHQGAYVTDQTISVTAITRTNPATVTAAAHGFSNGDEITFAGVLGMTELNNRNFRVINKTVNTFQLQNLDGTTLNATTYGSYTSGGSASRIYTLATPYVEADLSTLQYVQSADIITIAHRNYPPAELARLADNSWTLTNITFAPKISPPTGLTNSGPSGTDTKWVVTTIAQGTFEESIASSSTGVGEPVATTGSVCAVQQPGAGGLQHLLINGTDAVAGAWTCPFTGARRVTISAAGDEHSRKFVISGADINGNPVTETITGPTSTSVSSTNSFKSVSSVTVDDNTADFVSVGLSTSQYYPLTLTWSPVTGAQEYKVYKSTNGVFGFLGVAVGTTFKDSNGSVDTSITPPIARNPFPGAGDYPATVTYAQQRLTFASTANNPETVYTSRSANFHNYTTSFPLQSDDAVTFSLVGRQVNEVRHLIELGNLITFTSGGEWQIQGDTDGVIKPTAINPKQHSYNGSSTLPPIVTGGSAVYVQGRGGVIRDLAFDFQIDGYRGNDLTIFSAHLFDGHTIVDWCYQQIPHSIIWAARDDGVLLGLTYVKEQQIIAWHRHDFTNGVVEAVSSIPEGNEDFVYVIVKRTINGVSKRYVERLNTRQIAAVEDAIFVDSSLSYDGRNKDSTVAVSLYDGTTWDNNDVLRVQKTADPATAFTADDVGKELHLTGPLGDQIRCAIVSFTDANTIYVTPNRSLPSSMRYGNAISNFSKAVKTLTGLWHLEGQQVSVLGDGFVVANPNNPSDLVLTVSVSSGQVTLDKCYSVIHVGLPITSDLETLDIDTPNNETIADKKNVISRVTLFTASSRGAFVGSEAPSDDSVSSLQEIKQRNDEGYDAPIALTTGKMDVIIRPEWNSNGRIFIRQTDPLPLSVLAVAPAGLFPFKGPTGR